MCLQFTCFLCFSCGISDVPLAQTFETETLNIGNIVAAQCCNELLSDQLFTLVVFENMKPEIPAKYTVKTAQVNLHEKIGRHNCEARGQVIPSKRTFPKTHEN